MGVVARMERREGIVAFGEWELDFQRSELRRAGSAVDLQPTPLRVLLYLAAHRDRVVARTELLGHVWKGVVVGDEALTTAIAEARRAIGDDGAAQRVLRTFKGRGYRFVADARRADPTEPVRSLPLALAEAARLRGIGRAAELRTLTSLWDEARGGSRRIVLVSGEPGIGKTDLASRIASHATDGGAVVAYGRFDEDHAGPFQGWSRALRSAGLASSLAAGPLERTLAPLLRLLPELGELEERSDAIAHGPLEHAAELAALGEAVDEVLGRLSDERPLLLVLDDLHWADPGSLLVLRHVARSARRGRTLVVGTLRDSDVAAAPALRDLLADLRREHSAERLALRGLDEGEVGALIASRGGFEPGSAFVRSMRAKTNGNPFFVVELLRHLRELGAVRVDPQGWLAPDDVDAYGIPVGVREVVARRLERLPEDARAALELASVAGQEFEVALLGAAGRLARADLLGALDAAAASQLVASLRADATRFVFVHALVREAIYAGLSAAKRAHLHWAIADALERRDDAGGDRDVAIARHRAAGVLAGDAAAAAAACLRAAEKLGTLGAYEQSESEARRALELLAAVEGEAELRQRTHMALGRAQLVLGSPEFAASFEAAERIAAANGWNQRAAAAVVASTEIIEFTLGHHARVRPRIEAALGGVAAEPTRERALLLTRLLSCIAMEGRGEPVDAIADEALALARAFGDEQARIEVLHGVSVVRLGRPSCLSLFREGAALAPCAIGVAQRHRALRLAVADRASRGDRAGLDAQLGAFRRAGASAPIFSDELPLIEASIALADGRYLEAQRLLDECAALAPRQGRDVFQADVRYALHADRADTRALAEVSLPALEAEGVARPALRAAHAALLAELGRVEEAREALDSLLREDFGALPRDWSWPFSLRHLAEAAAWLEHAHVASALERHLAEWSGTLLWAFGFRLPMCAADRGLAQALAAQGRWREASAAFERALALEEGFGARALAARTRFWWARALRAEGRAENRPHAQRLARECAAFARGAGMRALAEHAEALSPEGGA